MSNQAAPFNPGTLLDALRLRAQLMPDRIVYTFTRPGQAEASITYAALDEQARALAVALSRWAVPGDRSLILLPHTLDYMLAFFASMYAGLIAIPSHLPARFAADGESGLKYLLSILLDSKAKVVVAPSVLKAKLEQGFAGKWRGVITSIEELRGERAEAWEAPPLSAESVSHLQYTSGSTASARAVMVTQANLIANMRMIEQGFKYDRQSVVISWLPFFHDMGLITMLGTVYSGLRLVALSPSDFIRRPYRWLKTISDYSATVSGGPNFAYELCSKQISDDELRTLDLSSWSIAFNGAETVRATTIERFASTFSRCGFRRAAFRPCYGLAEATVLATISNGAEGPNVLRLSKSRLAEKSATLSAVASDATEALAVVSCGGPCPGERVIVVDPDNGMELPDTSIGEIWIAGPNVAKGYWNAPGATEATFCARPVGGDAAFLRSGDLGFKLRGEIYVTGRLKELIIVRGRNFFPQDIEESVRQSCPPETLGNCAAFSIESAEESPLIVLAECAQGFSSSWYEAAAQKVRHAVFAHFELPVHALIFVEPRTLPMSSSGKLQRLRCRDLFLSEALSPLFSSVQNLAGAEGGCALEDPVALRFPYLFKYDPDPRSRRTLDELGIDSLDLALLAFDLERSYAHFNHELIEISRLYELTLDDCYGLLSRTDGAFAQALFQRMISAEEEAPDIAGDAKLHRISISDATCSAKVNTGGILLTGGTGFVGAFLLRELLERVTGTIALLVRSENPEHAKSRIQKSLLEHGLFSTEEFQLFNGRLEYLSGDLEKPCLGLDEATWKRLSNEVSTIYHNGASVNYIAPYSKLKPANVEGTREIIRLCSEGNAKFLHYISSTFIFGWAKQPVFETSRNAELQDVDFGYSQSKWAAEQLVWQALESGLRGRIYRPAMLTASRRAQFSTSDVTGALLLYFINHQVFVDMPNQISLMPVDFFCKRLVDFALLRETVGNSFHFTMQHATLPELCHSISQQFGYTFRPLSLQAFSEHLRAHCTPADLFFPFVNFYHRHFRKIEQMKSKRYMRDNYLATCALLRSAAQEPTVDQIVRSIVEYFQNCSLIHVSHST